MSEYMGSDKHLVEYMRSDKYLFGYMGSDKYLVDFQRLWLHVRGLRLSELRGYMLGLIFANFGYVSRADLPGDF